MHPASDRQIAIGQMRTIATFVFATQPEIFCSASIVISDLISGDSIVKHSGDRDALGPKSATVVVNACELGA